MHPPLIDTEHLAKVYSDGTEALRDASITVMRGEFVAVTGPSGSGKSTLLHILGFLDPPTSGTYRYNGVLSTKLAATLARVRNEQIGFVFQQFNLLPRESVCDNVYMPLYYSQVSRSTWMEKAERAVASVGLTHRLHAQAYTLSGGEKQRVAIARALINDPTLILADEPTGNLDSAAGKAIMDILLRLHTDGRTIVLITHDPGIAAYAQRTIVVRDGRVAHDTVEPL